MKKLAVLALVVVLVAVLLIAPKPFLITKTTTLVASQDAYIDQAAPTTNFDMVSTFKMGESRNAGSASFLKIILFKFDFSDLNIESLTSAQLIIRKASCVINGQGASLGAATVFSAGSISDWSASTVTWNSYPDYATDSNLGALFNDNPTCATAPDQWTFGVTTQAQSWSTTPSANRGLEIQGVGTWSGAGAGDAYSFLYSPQLVVEYTEPGTGPETGVGQGTNQTTPSNATAPLETDRLALAALIFVVVFILIAILARRRPGLAIVLGTVAGSIAAGGYLLLGGV